MNIKLKISIVNDKEEAFMGIGLVWLLKKIKETGSISRAAKEMNMSYGKAHRILKRLEKNMGCKFFISETGGIKRGSTTLTAFAEDFLSLYDEFQNKVKSYGEEEFSCFLKSLDVIREKYI